MVAIDGNNSLKQIQTIGQNQTVDLRVFVESDYYIPRDKVNKFANKVNEFCVHVSMKATAVSSNDQEDEWEDVLNDDIPGTILINSEDNGGGPYRWHGNCSSN